MSLVSGVSLVSGPWPAYERWPEPPLSFRERHRQKMTVQYTSHYLRTRDCRDELKSTLSCVWFVCRYGMQSYRDVLKWPVSEVMMSMALIGKWVEREGPKTSSSPS